ncbi:hypothetical protein [Pseudoalteromonas sp. C12FD-1]|uniref:hypothetical protein n=1 Tax=Pseudoalteromonas sp. C12FD-1 TaxID=3131979 RepID=UPI00307CEACF
MDNLPTKIKLYAEVPVDEISEFYNKRTNNALCPICKTGKLTFLATEDNFPSISLQDAMYINTSNALESYSFPVYTLICENCSSQQTINAAFLIKKMDFEGSDNES